MVLRFDGRKVQIAVQAWSQKRTHLLANITYVTFSYLQQHSNSGYTNGAYRAEFVHCCFIVTIPWFYMGGVTVIFSIFSNFWSLVAAMADLMVFQIGPKWSKISEQSL